MAIEKIPVLLLTGYLGSGKTTLLNRILQNKRGIKFAVIVNDIGEVNIDAELIAKGGIVGQNDDSLVALQNGCICCTLKMDLVEQLNDITRMHQFDYIVIEASGICEPAPIAQTICSIPSITPNYIVNGLPVLDSIVTVVDALRLKDEFCGGNDLLRKNLDEDDIENLVIQQIEFCNIILLNKASEVDAKELGRIREIIRAIQPKAEIIECDFCDVDLDRLVNTGLFDFDKVATSATWIDKVEGDVEDDDEEHDHHHDDDEHEEHHHHHHDDDEHEPHHHHHDEDGHEDHHHHHHDDDEHDEHHHHHDDEEHEHHHHHDHPEGCTCGHCHHHHHNEEEGEAEEYGIGTFVYYRREPFDLGRFDEFVARKWPKSIIRAKGMCYFRDERETCYVFEQAGRQVSLRNAGQWFAMMPKDELQAMLEKEPTLRRDWDEVYGDRMQKLVFIGQKMDKKEITRLLDECLMK
ncbi:MAG: GTP-binding protein [Bacteroidales bacterium]|nr:GTP-binding protein [Bacteroidales bacterium]